MLSSGSRKNTMDIQNCILYEHKTRGNRKYKCLRLDAPSGLGRYTLARSWDQTLTLHRIFVFCFFRRFSFDCVGDGGEMKKGDE